MYSVILLSFRPSERRTMIRTSPTCGEASAALSILPPAEPVAPNSSTTSGRDAEGEGEDLVSRSALLVLVQAAAAASAGALVSTCTPTHNISKEKTLLPHNHCLQRRVETSHRTDL